MEPNPTYCPVCSHALADRHIGGRTRRTCDHCGYVHYLNPVPGVGMLIEMDGGLVLIQRKNPPHQGRWTLPSGFVEVDESAEEAAIREAEEETGLHTEIIGLAAVNSFPEGPPKSGIMIFYRLKPLSGDLRAGDDAADVRLFQPGELPRVPFRTHREMVAEWLTWQAGAANPDVTPNLVTEQGFIIRRAETPDMNELAALLQLIPAHRKLGPGDWARLVQRFRDVDNLEIYVAEARQDPPIIIGMASFAVVRSLTGAAGFIHDMAVLPQFQRQGVGAALLEATLQQARRLSLDTLYVDNQHANQQAQAFYMASGFSRSGLFALKLS